MSRQTGQPGSTSKDGATGDSSWINSLPRSGKLQDYLTKTQTSKKSYSAEVRVPRRTLGISGSVSSQREKFQAISSSSDGGRKKAPSFDKELSDITCNHGDRIVLECRVSGSPSPKVTWYKDSEQIKYQKDYRVSQTGNIAKLSIVSASESDIGQFSCCATNSEGEATSVCYVNVEDGGEDDRSRSRLVTSRSRSQNQEDGFTREDIRSERLRNDSGGSCGSGKMARSELVIPLKRPAREPDDLNVSDPFLPTIKTLDDQELRVNKEVELVINTKGKVIAPLSARVSQNKVISSVEMKQDSNNNTGQRNERSEMMIFPEVGETDTDSLDHNVDHSFPSYDDNSEVRVSRRVESVVTRRTAGDGADDRETRSSHVTVSSMKTRNGVQEKSHYTARAGYDSDDVKGYGSDGLRDNGRLRGTSADSDQLERALDSVSGELRANYDSPRSNDDKPRSILSSNSTSLSSKAANENKGGLNKGLRNRFLEQDKGANVKRDELSSPKRLDPALRLGDGGLKSRSQKFEVNLKKPSDRSSRDDLKPKNELKDARFMLKKTSSPTSKATEAKSDGVASWQRKRFEMDPKENQSASITHPRFTPKSKGLSALRGDLSQPVESIREKRTSLTRKTVEDQEKPTIEVVERSYERKERWESRGTIEPREVPDVPGVQDEKEGHSSSNDEEPPAIPQSTFPGQLEEPRSYDKPKLDTSDDFETTENLSDRDAIGDEEEVPEKEEVVPEKKERIEEPVQTDVRESPVPQPEEDQEDTKKSLRKARLARMAEILRNTENTENKDSLWDSPPTTSKDSTTTSKDSRVSNDSKEDLDKQESRKVDDKVSKEDERIQELERRRQERKKLLEEERRKEEEEKQKKDEKKKGDLDKKKTDEEDFLKLAEQRREERRKKREEERRIQEEEEQRKKEEQEKREEERKKELERKQEERRKEQERKEEERRIEKERKEEERRLAMEKKEEERRLEKERREEERRLEMEKKEEEKRKEELRRKEEQEREEIRKEEEKQRREKQRRFEEEQRMEEEAREEARRLEEERLAEERRLEEEILKEEARKEEQRKLEEKKREEELEEERKREEEARMKEEEERRAAEAKEREEQKEEEKNTMDNISDLMFKADPNLTNGVNSDMSERSRRYTRESRPSFIIKPRRQFVDEGQVAKFKASFDGEPQPTVKWAYKNKPISDTSKYKIYEKNDFHFLEVNDVEEDDKGTYSITISNKLGTETMSAELEVFVKSKLTRSKKTAQPPKFEKELADMVVKDGDRVTLECTIVGTPEPTITWFFNKKLLKSSNDITQTYNGRRAKLTFVEVFPDDKGVYECVATNTGGEVKSSCTLTVEEDKPDVPQDVAPVFSKMLENITVQDGTMVSLECNVTANPAPKVIWYKAGVQVKANDDFIMTYDGNLARLLIQEVYPEDEGEYTCVAENPAGDARSKCKLIVKVPEQGKEEPPPTPKSAPPPKPAPKPAGKKTSDTTPVAGKPPTVIKKLKDMNVADGERVELVVEVEGSEPIDVVWLHGEKEIKKTSAVYDLFDEGTTHRLVVPEVYPEDSGLYVCEIYNAFGDAETNMTLTIDDREVQNNDRSHGHGKNGAEDLDGEDDEFYPPEFIRKPRSVNVEEGNAARFQCQIDAYPPPTVCWETDGKILENGGRYRISEDGEMFTFEIPHSLATDAGRYVVIATNSLGTEKYSVSLMIKEIESTEVTDFRGVLKSSRPKSSYGNSEVEVDQVDFRKVLQPNTITSTKARTGTIEADYKVQPDAEQIDFRNVLTRHVKTKERPTVKKELRDTQAREGEPIKLECIIIGTPIPEIRWYHGKKEVKESKYFKMSYERAVAVLYMAEVYKEDEGEYLCMAVNTAGTVHSSCDLKIVESVEDSPRVRRRKVDPSAMEPPLIEDLQPDNLHILRGTTAQLKAKFAGEPRPNVVWTHGKTTVSTGGRLKIDVVRDTTTLTIQDAQPDDSGIYTLSVDNELGCDTCSSSLTVEDKPNPPAGQPAASNITGTSLTLSWYGPSFDGGSTITDYRVELMKVGEVDWKTLTSNCKYTSFQVRNLEKNTEYLFRVSAANKHGFSDPGKISEVIVTIDRRRSSTKLEIPTDHMRDFTPSPLSPLSPGSFRALRDELAFEPRDVTISDRVFKDNYVLSDEIGRGKFGSVCLCIEKSSGRELAVKFIRIKATERDQAQQEVNIMNQLHHPKLLMLYDAFQTPREVILVMEHIAGGELFERIVDDDYILTERECVHFMRQIIDGVRFMHERNILHLDLKPENILCVTRNSNEIKIIDFGLARKFDPKKNFRVMFGTPEFVAPEVINYDQISYATDMWSIGVICYILISGISPFMGDNDAETLANVTAAQFDFDDKSFDPVTNDAKSFIEGMLTKNMRRRLTAPKALAHPWLAQDVKFMKAKRLSTEKHKRFLARRRWQKTGNAIRALGRMTNMQKAFKLSSGGSSASNSTVSGSIADTSIADTTQDSVLDDCISETDHLHSQGSDNLDCADNSDNLSKSRNGKLYDRDE